MTVILGIDEIALETCVKAVGRPSELCITNFNCPGQCVLSGSIEAVKLATEAAMVKGAKKAIPLEVQGAFHSPLMISAQKKLQQYIEALVLKPSSVQIAMNAIGTFSTEPDAIRDLLIRQITAPVRWQACMQAIDSLGIDYFVEIGCGKTLTALNKRIGVKAPTISIEKVADLDQIDGIVA